MNPTNAIPASLATASRNPATSTFNKTVFHPAVRIELIKRISLLDTGSTRQWGSMTLYQMLKHCMQWDEMALGKKVFKRVPLGLLLGRKALQDLLKERPFQKHMPTVPAFRITGDGDALAEKAKWIMLMEEYGAFSQPGFFHPFCGNVTKEQTGILAYKHADHHLRQFGV